MKYSVIIPLYNKEKHIARAIKSVLRQDYKDFEIIVIDDGSTDDTRKVLSEWIATGEIQYIYQENAGVSAARNAGARAASKDYLYFLDADDRVIASGLSRLRDAVGQQPDKAMIFGGHVTVDGERKRVHRQPAVSQHAGQRFLDYVIRRRFSIANGGAVLIKREVALRYPYPEELTVSEDFCVYAWVLANEPVASVADEAVLVKKHADSLRNQVAGYETVVNILPGILFNPDLLSVNLMAYRQHFYCNRLLSLFRAQYQAGLNSKALVTYRQAVSCRWLNVFKLSYLRKYIRCLLA